MKNDMQAAGYPQWNEEYDIMVVGFGGAGAALASIDACDASRFFSPPEAFISGILVNIQGERFCCESLYGATLSCHISEQPDRRAYLIIDEKLYRRTREQMRREERLRNFSLLRLVSGEMNALTGQVLSGNGSPIPGLYPAGRSAAGICSRSYVSGLSLADCIFSGRNAERYAAASTGSTSKSHKSKSGATHGSA